MKKIIIGSLLIGAFFIGKYWGEMSVILNQNIWHDEECHYIEYNGEVYFYSE